MQVWTYAERCRAAFGRIVPWLVRRQPERSSEIVGVGFDHNGKAGADGRTTACSLLSMLADHLDLNTPMTPAIVDGLAALVCITLIRNSTKAGTGVEPVRCGPPRRRLARAAATVVQYIERDFAMARQFHEAGLDARGLLEALLPLSRKRPR